MSWFNQSFPPPLSLIHCISRPLEGGDIVNVDVTVYLQGYHGDTSETFLVGDVVSIKSIYLKSVPS
jgi:methionine aminopeptidase